MEKECECYEEEVQPYRKTDYKPIIYITGVQNKPYDERLKLLNLYSVQRRRDRYQIIYLWKIIEDWSLTSPPPLRVHTQKVEADHE